MKNVIIVGAGGFGRELYSWLLNHPEYNSKLAIKGFLDDTKANKILSPEDPLNNYSIKVISSIDDYSIEANDYFVLGIGDPKAKEKIVSKLNAKNAQFLTFVHPSAVIGENVTLGEGVIVCPNVTITCDIKIGDFVMINANSTVGHDAVIGDYSTLSGHCDVTGNCRLGKGVFMGTHANLVPKTIVEDYAVIGAGTVGIRKVKKNSKIFGVPGKKLNV